MTDRVLKGFLLPSDETVKTGVYEEALKDLLKRADIGMPEIVRTRHLADTNCVMLVDDDGHSRGLPVNRRAQFLSGYPLAHPIVGDVLFFGEAWNDEDPGMDLVSIPADSLSKYLQNDEVRAGFSAWIWSQPVMDFSERYGLYMYGKDKPHTGLTFEPDTRFPNDAH
jgi:hypothetical protein